MRRIFLVVLFFALIAGCVTGGDIQDIGDPVITTAQGRLKGVRLNDPNVYVFKGVHYGESTAGPARFKAPKPVAAWTGVRDATKFGHTCPQGGDVGRRTIVDGELLSQSEDCLVLNVWTPGVDKKARPVMVWLHGRGFYAGAGSERFYDGVRLAKRGDVVVVTVNHRINIFGHLYLGNIDGPEFATSGNAGMQDLQLALEWVRDNIAAFGGDAGNVTIFGESGGGAKVATLLGVPSVKGLFRRGIIESGPRLQGMSLATATKNTEAIMAKLNVKTVAELQALPMETLLAAVTTTGRTTPDLDPVTDGKYLPSDMFVPAAAASAHGVPIIIGTNRDEYALFLRGQPGFGQMTEEGLLRNLEPDFGASVNDLLAAYRQSRPNATPWDLMIAIRSNRFHIGTVRLAQAQTKVAPVYVYSFDFEPNEQLKAAHGLEIQFVFSNATADPTARPGAKAVEDAMSEAWIAFARNVDPSHPGIPPWPAYTPEERATMLLDVPCRVESDPGREERLAWDGIDLRR